MKQPTPIQSLIILINIISVSFVGLALLILTHSMKDRIAKLEAQVQIEERRGVTYGWSSIYCDRDGNCRSEEPYSGIEWKNGIVKINFH